MANRTRSADITSNVERCEILEDAQERSNLEGRKATGWMLSPPEAGVMSEEDLGHSMVLLSRLARELGQWTERWGRDARRARQENVG